MSKLQIEQFTCRSDNFCVLVHDPDTGATAAIDAPESAPIDAVLQAKGWTLTDIIVTHKHGDHVEGIPALKEKYGCTVTGPEDEKASIPGIDKTVNGGDRIEWSGRPVDVIHTPGHTAGHVVYHFPEDKVLFAGDTLFSLGCGRLFERGADEMFRGLYAISMLPGDTVIYCGHEYTQSNANFAVTVDPENEKLQARAREVASLREKGEPTLPTRLDLELATNPFLRWGDKAIRAHLGMEGAKDWEVLGEIRKRKDNF